MTCNECGKQLKNAAKDFPKAVVEISNPETLVLLRKVVIPASMGDDTRIKPEIGKYHNVILQYEMNNHVYIYSSDGIPTAIEANIPKELLDRIKDLEDEDVRLYSEINELDNDLANEISDRETADTGLSERINAVASGLETEETRRIGADDALQANVNTVSGNLSAEVTARQNADTAIRGDLTALTSRVTTAEGDIDGIEEKIPAQATAQNQLADKDFVNSSVATSTANFIGTFNSLADLESYSGTVTNNDYAFVVVTDAQGNTAYDRYKYKGDTGQWAFEYELNNSSFTTAQWETINSGITSGDVAKLIGLASINSIGSNLSLDANGVLSGDYSNFAGTDGSANGEAGLVPAPATTDIKKFLKSDGTWGKTDTVYSDKNTSNAAAGGAVYIGNLDTNQEEQPDPTTVDSHIKYFWALPKYNNTVPSANSINILGEVGSAASIAVGNGSSISQNSDRSVVIGNLTQSNRSDNVVIGESSTALNSSYNVIIGPSSHSASGGFATSIGAYSGASYNHSVALGAHSITSVAGEVNVGTGNNNYGYNGTPYRIIRGVHDGQDIHDVVTLYQLSQRQRKPAIVWEVDGTTVTTGLVGTNQDISANPTWQLTNLDLTPYSRIKIYSKAAQKAGATASASTTPAIILEMSLDPRAAIAEYGNHFVASNVVQKPNDPNRLCTICCAVSADKTSFVVLKMTNLYGTAATSNSDVNAYVFKIEGYYD